MATIFKEVLYQPLLNALILLYNHLGDLGLAIIILTILIRFILFPLFYKGAKDQAILQRLAPKIKEIQINHKNDKNKQARALMELYREHRVSPFSGFLLLLVQLPILFALYRVFLNGFSTNALNDLYSFVYHPASLNHLFLNLIDLSQKNIVLIIGAAIAQYLQSKLSLPTINKPAKDLSPTERMSKQMLYLGPIMTIFILYFLNLPSAVALYWLTTSFFSVIQQIIINKEVALKFEAKNQQTKTIT